MTGVQTFAEQKFPDGKTPVSEPEPKATNARYQCPSCGVLMGVSLIMAAEKPGAELRVFQCRGCGYKETFVVEI